jgi:hypothetical protein
MPRLPFLDPKPIEKYFTSLVAPTRPLVIGLNGEKECGKDTFYGLFAKYKEGTERDAFADKLKVSAARALGYEFDTTQEYLEWADWMKTYGIVEVSDSRFAPEDKKISGREYLQFYGTEAHREVFDTDFWIDLVLTQKRDSEILVVTDVRFPNEAEAIRSVGGQVWRINRDCQRETDHHASEQRLPDSLVDVEIYNNDGLEELERKAKEMAESL